MPASQLTTCGELFDVGDDSCSASNSSVSDSASTDVTRPARITGTCPLYSLINPIGLNTSLYCSGFVAASGLSSGKPPQRTCTSSAPCSRAQCTASMFESPGETPQSGTTGVFDFAASFSCSATVSGLPPRQQNGTSAASAMRVSSRFTPYGAQESTTSLRSMSAEVAD